MKTVTNALSDLPEVIEVLKKGGVVAHPADTCYGLAADLMNPSALKKLQRIKGRDKNKPMSVMLPAYMKMNLEEYAVLDDFTDTICDKLLPGAVTIILPKGPKIPDYFFPNEPNIGIRIPYDIFTDHLLTKFQGPLITTSANLSDQPACCSVRDLNEIFSQSNNRPDVIVDGPLSGICLPSTVILPKNSGIKILREGPVGRKELEVILNMEVE
jgi:L-threonylcarbamoyladenylate synthase